MPEPTASETSSRVPFATVTPMALATGTSVAPSVTVVVTTGRGTGIVEDVDGTGRVRIHCPHRRRREASPP